MPKTVLLADDNVTIQRVVELTFAREDVRVVSVADGDLAVEAITRSAPDVVLAAIDLPGRSGFEVAQFVRSQPATAAVPVLLLAGAFEAVDRVLAHAAGADGILTKPFDPAVLVSRVMELLTEGRRAEAVVHDGPLSPSAALRSSRAIDALPTFEPVTDAVVTDDAVVLDIAVSDIPVADAAVPDAAVPDAPALSPEPAPAAADYFDQIDQAFAALARNPRPPVPEDDELPPLDDEPRPAMAPPRAVPPREVPPREVPLTDAFAALLEAERAGRPEPALRVVSLPPAAPVAAAAAAPAIDLDALADQIASRVLAQLSDRIVRETVADITSATAERLVREEIERIKRNIK